MNWLKQTFAVTGSSISSIPQRLGSATVTIIGVAGVVAVFVSVLSMASGFRKTLEGAGGDLNLIVLRDNSSSELDSGLSSDQVRIVKDVPGLSRDDAGAIASAELLVVVDLLKRSTNTDANVSLRGVEPHAFQLREKLKLVEGRQFEPGKMEVIAGRGAASQFEGLDIGNQLKIGQNAWEVVGVFASEGASRSPNCGPTSRSCNRLTVEAIPSPASTPDWIPPTNWMAYAMPSRKIPA